MRNERMSRRSSQREIRSNSSLRRRFRKVIVGLLTLTAGFAPSVPGIAADLYWNNASSQYFDLGFSPTPGAADRLIFNPVGGDGVYEVKWDSVAENTVPTVYSVSVGADDVTFRSTDAQPRHLNVTNSLLVNGAQSTLNVGTAGRPIHLTVGGLAVGGGELNLVAGEITNSDLSLIGNDFGDGTGDLNIFGGTYTAQGNVLFASQAEINIHGGSFLSQADFVGSGAAVVNIHGGQFANQGSTSDTHFNMTGGTLNVTSNSNLEISNGKSFTASNSALNVFHGAVAIRSGGSGTYAGDATQVGLNGSKGTLRVHAGSTASMGNVGIAQSTVGGTIGELTVDSGASLTLKNLNIAPSLGAGGIQGRLFVHGNVAQTGASTLSVGGTVNDASSVATLDVNGGTFTKGSGVGTIGRRGDIRIRAGGQFNSNGTLNFNGGELTVYENNGFTLGSGAQVNASTNATRLLFNFANASFSNNSSINVGDGAGLEIYGPNQLGIGEFGVANVAIDGSLNTSSTAAYFHSDDASLVRVGYNGGQGTLEFRNGANGVFNANVNAPGALSVGVSNSSATRGTLSVLSGANVEVSDLSIGGINTSANSLAEGTVIVDGVGSFLDQFQPGADLTIGRSGGGKGLLHVRNGGQFDTSSSGGNAVIERYGQLLVDDGVANIYRDVHVNGGRIDIMGGRINLFPKNGTAKQISLTNGATFEMTGGGLDVYSGLVSVDGAASSFVGGGGIIKLGDGGQGELRFTGGAQGDLGSVFLGSGTLAEGSVGVLSVGAGSNVGVQMLAVSDSGLAGQVGLVTVAGSLNQAGGNDLILGSMGGDPSSTGQFIVQSGGSFSSGPGGTIDIRSSGSLEIQNGSFTAPGDTMVLQQGGMVHLAGGTLEVGTFDHSHGGTFNWESGTLALGGGLSNFSSTNGLLIPDGAILAGHGAVHEYVHGGHSSAIQASGGVLSLGDANSFGDFDFDGTLDAGGVGAGVSINSRGFASLGRLTTMSGGTLAADNGIALASGQGLVGYGVVDAKLAAGFGSVIEATGNLSLGDASSVAGYFSDGELYTNTSTVTINDANVALLGSLTQIGDGVGAGALIAGTAIAGDDSLHFYVEQGKNVVGRGLIEGNFKNAGSVIGDGPALAERLVFGEDWTVSGSGTFVNTLINGTFAPGNSPGIVDGENLAFGGTVEIEIGGLTPGFGENNHDQINDMGTLLLGTNSILDIVPYNGFLPAAGDQFVIMTWQDGLFGSFSQVNVDSWYTNQGVGFDLLYNNVGGPGNLTLVASVPEPGSLVICGLLGMGLLFRRRRRV